MSYGVEGYYLTCDDAECYACFNENGGVEQWERDGGFEEWTEPLTITSTEESDTPTHCVTCGVVIEHNLTGDGYNYIAEAIIEDFSDGRRSPVVQQWIDAYGEYLDDDSFPGHELDAYTVIELHGKLPLDRGEWATKYLAHIDNEGKDA